MDLGLVQDMGRMDKAQSPKASPHKRQQLHTLESSGVDVQPVIALMGHHPTWHKLCPHPGHSRQRGLGPPCTLSSACPTLGTLLLRAGDNTTAT